MRTGIELIAQERKEQIEKHGRTVKHDVNLNNVGQLPLAAGLLLWTKEEDYGSDISACCPTDWYPVFWRRMMKKPYKDRLIIAAALIAAEVDRLQAIENADKEAAEHE